MNLKYFALATLTVLVKLKPISATDTKGLFDAPVNLATMRRLQDFNPVGSILLGSPPFQNGTSTEFGSAVELSSDGSTLVIGAPSHDWADAENATYQLESGAVYLYQLVNDTWVLTWFLAGAPGESVGDRLSLSDDGSRLALRRYDSSHKVELYDIVNGIGTKITEFVSHNFGQSISLSGDGSRVAISVESFSNWKGRVRVYGYDGVSWVLVGTLLDGHSSHDRFGWRVSLSTTGTRLAVSAPNYSNGVSKRGLVRVYHDIGGAWVQIGGDLVGDTSNDQFGFSLALSGDGNHFVCGAPGYNGPGSFRGLVRAYSMSYGVWTQLGVDMEGQNDDDRFGRSLSMSSSGERFMATTQFYNGSRGKATIYDLNEAQWHVASGGEILGDQLGELLGGGLFSAALSSDGMVAAVGSVGWSNSNDETGNGRVQVFEVPPSALSSSPSFSPSFLQSDSPSAAPSSFPSPSPSMSPSNPPSSSPTISPSSTPSAVPSTSPTDSPSAVPSTSPTDSPSAVPSTSPSDSPSIPPSSLPSGGPSAIPSLLPTTTPSKLPSLSPSWSPSIFPSAVPTITPSKFPTGSPSLSPSSSPSYSPSFEATTIPSSPPSNSSTNASPPPSSYPSFVPTAIPSIAPSISYVTASPTPSSSLSPSNNPSKVPSNVPSATPTMSPSSLPSSSPTGTPSSSAPSTSAMPSDTSSILPSVLPVYAPTQSPNQVSTSSSPSAQPSDTGGTVPSNSSSTSPNVSPTEVPSFVPTTGLTTIPSIPSMLGWDIERVASPPVVFNESAEEMTLHYNISSRDVRLTIFESDCDTVVGPAFVSSRNEFSPTSSTHGHLRVDVDFKEENITSSAVWSSTSPDVGEIDMCVRLDLLSSDGEYSVNFLLTKVHLTVNMVENFTVSDIGLEQKDAETFSEGASVEYIVQACQCNTTQVCIDEPIRPGDILMICLTTSATGVEFSQVVSLMFVQGDVTFQAFPNAFTFFEADGQSLVIYTRLVSAFFMDPSPADVEASGEVTLEFGGRRLHTQIRDLVGETSRPFLTTIQLEPADERTIQSIESSAMNRSALLSVALMGLSTLLAFLIM